MKRFLATTAAAIAAIGLLCSAASAEEVAKGWWSNGSRVADYDFGTEQTSGSPGGRSAFVRAKGTPEEGFGGIMQTIRADNYLGQRVRLSGQMKTAGVARAQMWLRVDGGQKVMNFYNMNDRPVTGTTDWKRYEIVLDVPPGSTAIAFGFFLSGKGTVWADDFTLASVANTVSVSASTTPQMSATLVNSGFE